MFGNDLLMTFIALLKLMHLENIFHHTNNLHLNINFTMEEESNGELAFLVTLIKRNTVIIWKSATA